MNAFMNGIINREGCCHNLHKLAKMAIFTTKAPAHKKKRTSRLLTQPLKFGTKIAHGYPSQRKMRSYFIKQPPDLAPSPRGATGEFLDLARPPPRL